MLLLLLALLACGPEPAPPAAVDPDAPRRYRVLRGDTLKTIASKRSCHPADLIAWNELGEDPLLVPGQILKIYRANYRPERAEIPTGDDSKALPHRELQAPPGAVAAADTQPTPERGSPSPRAAPSSPRPSSAPAATQRRVVVGSPNSRGSKNGVEILSLLDDLEDAELKHVASVQSSGRTPGQAGLDGRSLEGSAAADSSSVELSRRSDVDTPGTLRASGRSPRLPKAKAKNCLPVVMRDLGDKGMAAPDGLDRAAIRRGMAPIVTASAGCLASSARGSWEVHVEVTVGCDGLVYRADVVMDGGLSRDITRCVADVAKQGSFDAAQGVTPFVYPIRFSGS